MIHFDHKDTDRGCRDTWIKHESDIWWENSLLDTTAAIDANTDLGFASALY